jgi:uncharacterized protein YajQ (UPF0234 family)
MITLDQVAKRQDLLFDKCKSLVKMKGADYNREQQQSGDTLFNMRVSKLLGITDTTTQGVLTRLSDKFMRLISLTKNPKVQAQVKDESVRDTIVDAINYLTYLSLFYDEERQDLQSEADQDWIKRQQAINKEIP